MFSMSNIGCLNTPDNLFQLSTNNSIQNVLFLLRSCFSVVCGNLIAFGGKSCKVIDE